MKRSILSPRYMKKFRCIGSSCEDTCCAGWGVSVDQDTYKKYKRVTDYSMKKRLEKHVGRNRSSDTKYDIAKIRLQDGKCPFLLTDGLCEIHSSLGDAYLSNTCTFYPRTYKEINGVIEESLVLSCPEAARLVLLNPNLMEFDQEEREFSNRDLFIETANPNLLKKGWKDYFWELRICIITILQNRSYSIEERLFILGLFMNKLDEIAERKNIESIQELINTTIRNMENGNYKGALDELPTKSELHLGICQGLVDKWYQERQLDDKYKKCLNDVMEGLELDKKDGIEEIYKEAHKKYYKPFIEKQSYIIENYLVNNVFKDVIPIDQDRPFESYTKLIFRYALIKTHLIGIANKNNKLDEENIISTIQLVVKTYEHDSNYFERVSQSMKEVCDMSLAYMLILLKG